MFIINVILLKGVNLLKNIIIGMVLAVLLIGLGVGGYVAYDSYSNSHGNNLSGKEKGNLNNNSSNNKDHNVTSNIDVLSDQFSSDFMKSDVRNHFYELTKGMSKEQVEEKFGKSEGYIPAGQSNAEKYGNLAVRYDNHDIADHIFIAPDNVSVEDFEAFHGPPNIDNNQGLVYDGNPNNNFSILVTTQNGMVTAIENADQINRSNESTDDAPHSSGASTDNNAHPVNSKEEAMAIAQGALDKEGEGGWVHSALDDGNKWRVNVGRDSTASNAHDVINIYKHNGIIDPDY